MVTLAIAGLGAAIGYGIGGTATALAIGWTVGSYLGQVLFPTQLPDAEGPRVTDLAASTSAYGLARTRIWGTVGVAGNLIWSDDLTEVATTESVGGGKGGGSVQDVTTFTYTVSAAWALCEGPVDAVRRIWFDSELVYDHRDTNLGVSIKEGLVIRTYTGGETQIQDTTISDIEGLDTPAYRGTCYFVVTDMLLTDYGNRRPNIRAEVVKKAARIDPFFTFADETQHFITRDTVTNWIAVSDNSADDIYIFDGASGALIATYPMLTDNFGFRINAAAMHNGYCYGESWETTGNRQGLQGWDAITGAGLWASVKLHFSTDIITNHLHIQGHDEWLIESGVLGDKRSYVWEYAFDSAPNLLLIGKFSGVGECQMTIVEPDTAFIWFHRGSDLSINAGVAFLDLSRNPDWPAIGNKWNLTLQSHSWLDFFDSAGEATSPLHSGIKIDNFFDVRNFWNYDPSTQSIITYQNSDDGGTALPEGIYRIQCHTRHDLDTMFIAASNTDTGPFPADIKMSPNNRHMGTGNPFLGPQSELMTVLNAEDLSFDQHMDWDLPQGISAVTNIANWNQSVVYGHMILTGQTMFFWDRWPDDGIGLDVVVSDICLAHSLAADEFDVTDLATVEVKGFAIGRPVRARNQIESLMAAYFFDAVESDKKIKFRLKDRTSLITIPQEDLAAREPGKSLPDAVLLKRKELYQLPQTVQITHLSRELEYEPSSQYARQPTSPTADVLKMEFPLVFSDDEAAQIAEIWMQSMRSERHSGSIILGPEYFEYDPTDIVTVNSGNLTFNFRLLKTALGGLPMITKADVSTYDVGAYSSTAKGAPGLGFKGGVIQAQPISTFFMVNSPPLRDFDNDGGFYGVVSPYADLNKWQGSEVKRRDPNDAQAPFLPIKTTFAAAIVANEALAVALPAGANETTFDWVNSITVRPWNDQALTTETQLDVLNFRNVLYFPETEELMQFQIATDNLDGTYTLTGLLRGRRGTDYAVGLHTPNEPVVLIEQNKLYKFNDNIQVGGKTMSYISQTFGTLESAQVQTLWTQKSNLVTPLSPVHLAAIREADDDLFCTWVRRARLDAEWLDDIDVPLDERVEQYVIELYQANDLLRTEQVLAQNFTYTAADQRTDTGGDLIGQFNFCVYQWSERVGRGRVRCLDTIFEPFSTNFDEYVLPNVPNNGTRLTNLTGSTFQIDTDGTSQVLESNRTAVGHNIIRWDRIIAAADYEVLVKTKTVLDATTGGVGTQSIHGVILRASEPPDTPTHRGFLCGFWGDTGTFQIVNWQGVANIYISVQATTFKAVDDEYTWMRIRLSGSEISSKAWADGDTEPPAWMWETVGADAFGSGQTWLTGAYQGSGGPEQFDFFSIAYNGATAPGP
jgi:hypothetical protein